MVTKRQVDIPLLSLSQEATTSSCKPNSQISIAIKEEKNNRATIKRSSSIPIYPPDRDIDRSPGGTPVPLSEDQIKQLDELLQKKEENNFLQIAKKCPPLEYIDLQNYFYESLRYDLFSISEFLMDQCTIANIICILQKSDRFDYKAYNFLLNYLTTKDANQILMIFLLKYEDLYEFNIFVKFWQRRNSEINMNEWHITQEEKFQFLVNVTAKNNRYLLELLLSQYTTSDVIDMLIHCFKNYENSNYKKCFQTIWMDYRTIKFEIINFTAKNDEQLLDSLLLHCNNIDINYISKTCLKNYKTSNNKKCFEVLWKKRRHAINILYWGEEEVDEIIEGASAKNDELLYDNIIWIKYLKRRVPIRNLENFNYRTLNDYVWRRFNKPLIETCNRELPPIFEIYSNETDETQIEMLESVESNSDKFLLEILHLTHDKVIFEFLMNSIAKNDDELARKLVLWATDIDKYEWVLQVINDENKLDSLLLYYTGKDVDEVLKNCLSNYEISINKICFETLWRKRRTDIDISEWKVQDIYEILANATAYGEELLPFYTSENFYEISSKYLKNFSHKEWFGILCKTGNTIEISEWKFKNKFKILLHLTDTNDEALLESILCDYTNEEINEICTICLRNYEKKNFKKCFDAFKAREKNIDVNKLSYKNKLEILINASANNNVEILKLLLGEYECLHSTVLVNFFKTYGTPNDQKCFKVANVNEIWMYCLKEYETGDVYKKCYEILLAEENIDVNWQNEEGFFPLHYASRLSNSGVTLRLLEKGASLENRNNLGVMTIENINYSVLKEYFDSCIFNESNKMLSYDYKNLTRRENSQMEVILFIAESDILKPLLLHPLILSFIHIKYEQFRKIFFYSINIRILFYIFMFIYTIFWFKHNAWFHTIYFYIFVCIFLIFNTFFVVVEIFQCILLARRYFTKYENYIEIIVFGLYYYMLCVHSTTNLMYKQISGISIALTIILLYTLIPSFLLEFIFFRFKARWIFTYVNMLITIIQNCLKVVSVFFVMILCFSISFWLLFETVNEPEIDIHIRNVTNSTKLDKADENVFNYFITSFPKVILMLTGEFELENINIDFDYVRLVFFLVFAICFSIPFINMLNGLAVSDIQEIKNEANISPLIIKVQYLAMIEIILLNDYGLNKLQKLCHLIIKFAIKLFNINIYKVSKYIATNKLEFYLDGKAHFKDREMIKIGIGALDRLVINETKEIVKNMNRIKQEALEGTSFKINEIVRITQNFNSIINEQSQKINKIEKSVTDSHIQILEKLNDIEKHFQGFIQSE